MGYTGIFTDKPLADVLKEDALPGYEIVDLEEEKRRPVDGEQEFSVFYAALRRKDRNYVFGCVVLVKAYRDQGKREVMWKEMDESVGPSYDGCPRRIIQKLTPIDSMPYANDYSREWRQRCLKNSRR